MRQPNNLPQSLTNHNLHWVSIEDFRQRDPQISALESARFIHHFKMDINLSEPAVHLLLGPRQLGKSTLLKSTMLDLLKEGWDPESIWYVACDGIVTLERFEETLRMFGERNSGDRRSFLFLDEVQFIANWALIFKAVLDEGLMARTVVVITGSDASVLKDSKTYFPGVNRRGLCAQDLELFPITFAEFLKLESSDSASHAATPPEEIPHGRKMELFKQYIKSGGFPASVNQILTGGSIPDGLYSVYEDWIVGDFLRKNRDKTHLGAVLQAVITTLGSQNSFSRLHQHVDRGSLPTTIEYLELLEHISVIRIVSALDQGSLGPAQKKSKKFHFRDPLLAFAVENLLRKQQRLGKSFVLPESILVEGIVSNYLARQYPTYYLKAEGEVDVAIVREGGFIPIEVKWAEQTRSNDFKQLKKYKNGILLRKEAGSGIRDGVRIFSLVDVLAVDDLRWLDP